MESKYEIRKNDEGLHAYLSEDYTCGWVFSILKANNELKLDWNDYLVPALDDVFFIVDIVNHFDSYMKSASQDTFDPDSKFWDGKEELSKDGEL